MDIFSVSNDSLFTFSAQNNAQKETFAQRMLSTGLDQFASKQYELAIGNFKRVVSMAPTSDAALNAYDYMARAQLTQGDTDAAIASYTKALKIAPNRDDLHMQLGKIFTTLDRYDEAREQYELAVKYNPSSANRYALGQGYLGAGQFSDAIQQFEQVRQLGPKEPFGYFGLGQAYARQGDHNAAIRAFQSAIAIQYDYLDAYSEMGYAYVDSGQMSLANDVVTTLNTMSPNDTSLASSLSQYIYEKARPKMTSVYASDLYSPFISSLGPRTSLNGLSSYLANAGDEHTFAMVFQFNKPMDFASVENVFNWSITRATGTGRADGYNYDMPLPASEVTPPPRPMAVYYNQQEQTATVLFSLRQNDTADGTLDPSHINFTFKGKDAVGLSMDKSADMYSGFSGFA
jgi:Flp pilus assembly protein TadD